MLQTNAGRGARCVDWARRAQIADGVRGPRADASESTRCALCAAPCLSTHVTVGPPVSSLSAWRRRAMQPGGVSANDTQAQQAPRARSARGEGLAGLLFEASDDQLVRAASDRLGQDGEAGFLDAPHVGEIDGEVAHALADEACHGRGAFSVQLSAEAEDHLTVLD